MRAPKGGLEDIRRARGRVEMLGRLSDGLVRIGPLRLGLDGFLAWIPGAGEVYSLGAGVLLALLAARVGAPLSVVARVLVLVGLRSLAGAPASALLGPLYPASGLVVDFFRAHRMAADLILKSMDATVYLEAEVSEAAEAEARAEAARAGRRVLRLRPRRSPEAGRSRAGR